MTEGVDYSKPHEVTDLQIAFPADLGDLLPPYQRTLPWADTAEAKPFLDFTNTWFSQGLGGNTQMSLKEGIEGDKVLRHLRVLMGSFEPKHEHKIAGVAYLLAQWCDWVRAEPAQDRV